VSSDARLHLIRRNLSSVGRVYVVVSTKGGVGKSTVSTLIALHASRRGYRVGLLDVDFANPSTHILLGVDPGEVKYREEKGIEPYILDGLRYVSIVAFTGDNPLPLRGSAAEDALRELLAIVKWGELDLLLIDTPPGISDEHLNLVYLLRDIVKPLVVTTPSTLSLRSITRLITLLREAGYPWIGLIENMGTGLLRGRIGGVEYLGYIPYVDNLEECMRSRMTESCVDSRLLDTLVSKLLGSKG